MIVHNNVAQTFLLTDISSVYVSYAGSSKEMPQGLLQGYSPT